MATATFVAVGARRAGQWTVTIRTAAGAATAAAPTLGLALHLARTRLRQPGGAR